MTADSASWGRSIANDFPSRSREQPHLVVRRTTLGQWLVLEIAGEMDIVVGPMLCDVGRDPCFVVFDLHRVTFMDCSSLSALENTQHRAVGAGGAVRLAAASEQVLRVLMLTGMDRAFPQFDSVGDAIAVPTAFDQTASLPPRRRVGA